MTFTRQDVKDNPELITFIRVRVKPDAMTTAKNTFHSVAVYKTSSVIEALENRVKKYRSGKYKKFGPTWVRLLKYVKEMEDDK